MPENADAGSLYVDLPTTTFQQVLYALRMGYASACELEMSEEENVPKQSIQKVYDALRELHPEHTQALDNILGRDLKTVMIT